MSFNICHLISCKATVRLDLLLLNFDLKQSIRSSWNNGILERIFLWGDSLLYDGHNFIRIPELLAIWISYLQLPQVSGNSRVFRFCADNIQSCPCPKFRSRRSKLSRLKTKTKCISVGEFEIVLERRYSCPFLFWQVPSPILAASF